MRLTGSAKSTQKRGAMALRRTHCPQILFLEKKDPWGTVSGLENPLPFLGYLSHSVLYRISKYAHCKLCNNGMFAPFWWRVFFGIAANTKVLYSLLTYQLKNTFLSFLYTSELLVVSVLHFMGESYFCPLNSSFVGQDLLPTIVFFLRVVCIGLSTLTPLFSTNAKGFLFESRFCF